jgi:hypothetical protein
MAREDHHVDRTNRYLAAWFPTSDVLPTELVDPAQPFRFGLGSLEFVLGSIGSWLDDADEGFFARQRGLRRWLLRRR